MKLYYFTGACALSPHIVALELGLNLTTVKIDSKSKQTSDGADYLKVNSKGSVPALELDNGEVLTEGPAIVQYLADQRPDSGMVPRAGTLERYRMMEMLNYISTEVHKGFSPLFNPAITPEWKAAALQGLERKFDWLSNYLGSKPFLFGDSFTVADAYLFTVLGWTKPLKIDLGRWPLLKEYHARILQRPKVQEAMRAEGLVK
jgi:glutathione S-transferase